jgi:DNA-3-methyladenine glycosylase
MANSSIRSSKNVSVRKALPLPGRILTPAFYERPTLDVARELLGKILVTRIPALGSDAKRKDAALIETIGRIVETEAYRGDDAASHSARGKTPRSEVMFGKPGNAYVYFIYGNYEMLNFVTEPDGIAGAVLIRALEPLAGIQEMRNRRKRPLDPERLCDGPGKLCRSMGIEMRHNKQPIQGPEIWVVDDGFKPGQVRVSPRVGIRKAKKEPWRFYVGGNPCVSRCPQNAVSSPA